MKTKENKVFDPVFYKKLLSLAGPIAFQNLMLALVAASDAFMLGSVEQNSMAAVSLATQIQFVQNMILYAVINTASILGAQYWGKGDKKTLNEVFAISLRIAGITSFVFFIGCVFFPEYLMLVFTNEPVLVSIGAEYLRIAGWSYLLTGISQCYLTIMKVTEHAASSAKISSAAVLLNIFLNAAFIYGFFGIPKMGVRGAAYATLIARVIELICAIFVSYRPGHFRFAIRALLRRNKMLSGDYRKCCLPLLGAGLLWGIGFTSYSAFMGHLGTDATAANSIAAVIRDLICCLCDGIATGGGILVGNELGAGKLEQGKKYGDKLVKISFVCGFLSTLFMLAMTPAALQVVKLTDMAKHYLFGMMVVMAVYMIGRAVNTVTINGILAAGGDTLFDMYSLVVTMWMIAIPLAVVGTFVLKWPVIVVYACTCLDEVGKIPWVLIHYKKYRWVKNLTR